MKWAWFLIFLTVIRVPAHPGSGIAVDSQGRIFFTAGSMIILIETNGTARTIVHDKRNEKFYQLHHIQHAPDGGLLTASDLGNAIWRFTPEGQLTKFYPSMSDGKGPEVGVGGDPFAVDAAGNIYAVRSVQFRSTQILKIRPDGEFSLLAGGDWGVADGPAASARFANLHGGSMLVTPEGALLVTDNSRVRRVALDGRVSTLAGGTNQVSIQPWGLALDDAGNIFFADHAGFLRRIARDGEVTVIAGSRPGRSADGPLLQAVFDHPTGLARSKDGELFVLEPGEFRVRKVSRGQVTTIHRGLP